MFDRKTPKQENRQETTSEPHKDREPAAPAPSHQQVSKGAKAMIGAQVKVSGDIESKEDLLIEGEVSGTISTNDHEVVVGTSGRVQADISAKTVRIEGEVQGDITASERVVISASGDVQGNVTAPRVILEDGGRFKGSIDMGSPSAAKPAAAPTPKPAPLETKPGQQSAGSAS